MLAVNQSEKESLTTKRKFSSSEVFESPKDEAIVFGGTLAVTKAGSLACVLLDKVSNILEQGVDLIIEGLKPYVDQFIDYARSHPNQTFSVTKNDSEKSRFEDEEIAPLFQDSLDLQNVQLPKSYVEILLSPYHINGEVTPPWDEVWIEEIPQDIPLTEQQFANLCKSFRPDWEFRYAPIQVGDWIYMCRNGFWVKKYKYVQQQDNLYHITESYTTDRGIGINIHFDSFVRGYYQPKIFERDVLYHYQNTMTSYGLYVKNKPDSCLCCGYDILDKDAHNWECPICKTIYSNDNL